VLLLQLLLWVDGDDGGGVVAVVMMATAGKQ
jgi:hypothetical protein